MKYAALIGSILGAVVLVSTAAAAKPLEGSISGPNEAGPYQYGDSVTFSTSSNLKGNNPHPMVEVACYQDANGDGEVTLGFFVKDANGVDQPNLDLVWLQLDKPGSVFSLGTVFDSIAPATCEARLLAYGWKGGQQSIVELDSVEFSAGP